MFHACFFSYYLAFVKQKFIFKFVIKSTFQALGNIVCELYGSITYHSFRCLNKSMLLFKPTINFGYSIKNIKHLTLDCHFVGEQIQCQLIRPIFTSIFIQLTNIFTKDLGRLIPLIQIECSTTTFNLREECLIVNLSF